MQASYVTLITTVLNEESTIEIFLESLFMQTELPDEIIIVDGGSKDSTIDLIHKKVNSAFNTYNQKKVIVISHKGNIASGRNYAIKHAKNERILCTDAGCILDKNWVKEMKEGFEKGGEVISGFYFAKWNNIFENCLATYTSVMPEKLDPITFLPSSRSIGFLKKAWSSVGGYPEYLDTCEDLIFARKLKDKGYKFVLQKNAFVYWPQRRNFVEAFLQFFRYANGDGKARYIRKNTPFLFIRYFFLFILLLNLKYTWGYLLGLALIYLFWAVIKNFKYVNKIEAIVYLPLLQFTADIAVMLGMIKGSVESLFIKHER